MLHTRAYRTLCYKKLLIYTKISVMYSGSLYRTLNSADFSHLSSRTSNVVDRRKYCRIRSAVASSSHRASTFVYKTFAMTQSVVARFVCDSRDLLGCRVRNSAERKSAAGANASPSRRPYLPFPQRPYIANFSGSHDVTVTAGQR